MKLGKAQREALRVKYSGLCAYCGNPSETVGMPITLRPSEGMTGARFLGRPSIQRGISSPT